TVEQLAYAAADARVLPALRSKLDALIAERRLEQAWALERALLPLLVQLQSDGVAIDADAWRTVAQDAKAEAARLADEIRAEYGWEFSLSRTKELAPALRALGLTLPTTRKGNSSMAAHVLKPYAETHPGVAALLDWRKFSKAVGSFGETFLATLKDGR